MINNYVSNLLKQFSRTHAYTVYVHTTYQSFNIFSSIFYCTHSIFQVFLNV